MSKAVFKVLLFILFFIFAFFFSLLLVAMFLLPQIAGQVLNDRLPEILKTGASVGEIEIDWFSQEISAQKIIVEQPEGFEKGTLLSLGKGRVRLSFLELLRRRVIIDKIILSNLDLDIKADKAGKLNLMETFASIQEWEEELMEIISSISRLHIKKISLADVNIKYADVSKEAEFIFPNFSVAEINFEAGDLALNWASATDAALAFILREKGKAPLIFNLEKIKLFAKKIVWIENQKNSRALPSKATLIGRIKYEKFPDAFFGCYVRFAITGKIPPLAGTMQTVGLELEPLQSILSPGTFQVLGGDGVDVSAFLSVSQDLLDCRIDVLTNQGIEHDLVVGGTADKPKVDTSSILFKVLSRVGGGVGGVIINFTGATVDLSKSLISVVLGIGLEITKTAAEGAFEIATGVVTVDIEKTEKGLKKATVEEIEKTGEMIVKTEEELVTGTVKVVEAPLGKAAVRRWRNTKEERFYKLWRKARETVDKMDYPGAKD